MDSLRILMGCIYIYIFIFLNSMHVYKQLLEQKKSMMLTTLCYYFVDEVEIMLLFCNFDN